MSEVSIDQQPIPEIAQRLADECEQHAPFYGIVESDESYFDAKRIRGKRRRSAGGKTIMFGILKRDDKIYTEIVSDASKATNATKDHQRPYRGREMVESVIYTDG